MITLVAGCAALYDLVGSVADAPADRGAVGDLTDGPAAVGRWLPAGSALTVALAMAGREVDVALWHPLPRSSEDGARARLAAARIDVTRSPVAADPARCIVLRRRQGALSWSGRAPLWSAEVPGAVLDGIDHLVLCPRFGPWSDSLATKAARRGIPRSIVGQAPPSGPWRVVVVSEVQVSVRDAAGIDAELLVITRGAAGSRIRFRGEWVDIAALPARVVDPTGAGDVFAGVLLGEMERGRSVQVAASAASAAAAHACEAWGAQATLISPRRVHHADQASRARGALWGLACGDAFGMPASFVATSTMHRLWPDGITDLVPAPDASPYHAGYPAGRITDDTEQAQALTRAAIASRGPLDAELVARELYAWYEAVGGDSSLAVGPSTRRGLTAWRKGTPLADCGRAGTSNGGAMRIAPVGVLHGLLASRDDTLLDDVTAACLATHNTAPAMAAAAAVAASIATGVGGGDWSEVLSAGAAAAVEAGARGTWVYAPDVATRVEFAISLARGAESDAEASRQIARLVGTGEPSSEAVPAAFGIAARAEGDPQRAIILAANTEGDTDTIAAMAGAICGSWAGDGAVPLAWRRRVAVENRLDVDLWVADLQALAAARAQLPARG